MGLRNMIKKIKRERRELKVLTIGIENSGKTTILNKKFGVVSGRIQPTFGYRIYNTKYKDFNIILLDVGGQSIFQKYWSNYYEKIDALIYVSDLTRFESSNQHLNDIINDVCLKDIPVLVFANKLDLCIETIENKNIVNSFPKDDNTKFVMCSALENKNLDEGLDWLLDRTKSRSEIVRL